MCNIRLASQGGSKYLVETYSDEAGNWYRLYSDGWIEQGGIYRGYKIASDANMEAKKIFFVKNFTAIPVTFLTHSTIQWPSGAHIRTFNVTNNSFMLNNDFIFPGGWPGLGQEIDIFYYACGF